MSTEAILAFILMLGVATLAVLLPFMGQPTLPRRAKRPANHSAVVLEEQLMQIVNAVRDLDFDFDTGKVAEADYVDHRKMLIGRGVSTLIRLDDALAQQKELDQYIEDLIADYRHQRA